MTRIVPRAQTWGETYTVHPGRWQHPNFYKWHPKSLWKRFCWHARNGFREFNGTGPGLDKPKKCKSFSCCGQIWYFWFLYFFCKYLYCISCFLSRIAVTPLLACSRCEWLSMLPSVQKWIQLTHVFPSGTATATTASLTVGFPNGPGPGSSCAPKVFPVMILLGACRHEIWHARVRWCTTCRHGLIDVEKMVNSISYRNLGSHRCGQNVEIYFIVWGVVNSVVKVHGCPMRFQYPSPKNKIWEKKWMCHTKKHVDLDKHKHMTMKFFCPVTWKISKPFFVLSSFGWWEQNRNKPFGPPWRGFQVWWWDTWKQIREVEWCCWTDENPTRNDSINLPSDYSNMPKETWQWKLDHLKMYVAVNMLIFKPSMLVYRTLQGKLWCKMPLW